jgi:cytochrome c oxidase subunit 2
MLFGNSYFQDPATPIMEGIVDFHNYVMFYVVLIFLFVFYFFLSILIDFSLRYNYFAFNRASLAHRFDIFKARNVAHASTLEFIWTVIPSMILALIAVPSFLLLYSMDEVIDPALTLKAIGHQWYWSYEYSDYEGAGINFDSYMIPTAELSNGSFRLLEVDNSIVVPTNTHVRLIVTAADVLHSWAVPSLGVKVDAVPGRLNQSSLFIKRQGVYYGQCSELCGVNHGFMPIAVKAVDLSTYLDWLAQKRA